VIHCCIGIMAYNEEANIRLLLQALLVQKTEKVAIDEIVVVASGCTDGTEDIVKEYVAIDPRVRLLSQARKEGKASAVNLLLRNTECEVVVLESADTLPLENTIEALVSPMTDPKVGMVGGRPVPVNSPKRFMGYGAHLVWELHHQMSLRHPKMGEVIAFRNIFAQIPHDSAVDEASIEPLIIGQGLRLHYAPGDGYGVCQAPKGEFRRTPLCQGNARLQGVHDERDARRLALPQESQVGMALVLLGARHRRLGGLRPPSGDV
jgi:biofilm PGA synthesis N-glycosyltransferase PgaC